MIKTVVKRVVVGVALALGVVAAVGAMRATDWGNGYKDFAATCDRLGGVVNGKYHGATCSFNGGITRLPAARTGWTIDVAQGTVATYMGATKVVEQASNGTVIVACHNADGERQPAWEEGCAAAN